MANLSDFTYFANRSLGGVDDPNSDRAQQALAAVRQYDQNAQYRPTYGSDNQLLGYTLDFDASKLPGANGQGSLGPTSGHGSGGDYMPRFSTVQPGMLLDNPAAVTNSPIYGNITDNTNINPRDSKLMSLLGPLAVAGFAFGAPFLASAMSNGALGAGAAAADAAGSAAGSLGDGQLLPMMPTDPASLYTPMLPFNAADPSLAINGIAPGGAAAGLSGTQAAAPIADFSTEARPIDIIRNLGNGASLTGLVRGDNLVNLARAAGSLLSPGGGSGGGVGMGGGTGLLNAGPGATEDAMSVLRKFYGDPFVSGALNKQRVQQGTDPYMMAGLLNRGIYG